jgi:P27 family predicted phage terminase small subunit
MGARGKKPKGALAVVTPQAVKRLEPPGDMSKRDAQMFKDIVAKNPADQFKVQDIPLLREYCEACGRSQDAQKEIDELGLLVPSGMGSIKANPAIAIRTACAGVMAQLATKLKLCPSCRSGGRVPKGKEIAPDVDAPPKRKMFGA